MGVLNCIFLDANKFFVANVFTVDADWLLNVIFMGSSLVAEGSFLRTLGWNHTLGPDGRLAVIVSNAGDVTRELGVITGFDLQLIRRAPPLSEP